MLLEIRSRTGCGGTSRSMRLLGAVLAAFICVAAANTVRIPAALAYILRTNCRAESMSTFAKCAKLD